MSRTDDAKRGAPVPFAAPYPELNIVYEKYQSLGGGHAPAGLARAATAGEIASRFCAESAERGGGDVAWAP